MYLARTIVTLIVVGIIGFVGYQIGITQNIAAQLPAGAAPVAYYGYPYHFGFGFLGFLVPLFFLFLFFGLLRAAFGGGRGWGTRGSRYGWYGHGWDGPGGLVSDEARSRIEQLHKELHGEKPTSGGGGPSATST